MKEAQELYCHNCGKYVQFSLDVSFDENYLLYCPNCGHKHYRVVENGKITDRRWGQDPSQQGSIITGTSSTTTSVSISTTSSNYFLANLWATTTTA